MKTIAILRELVDAWQRKRHRRLMMRAIRAAAGDDHSLTDGLRVIRTFERVNGVTFDPTDRSHMTRIYNMGQFEAFFRALKRDFSRTEAKPT